MDVSQLAKLGKVAGVPGIALGAVVLLLGAVLAAANVLPEGWRGPVMVVVVVGVVLLGVLAVRGSARGNRGDARESLSPRATSISHVGLQRSPVSVSHSVGPPGRRPPTADRQT
jgi:hypothetical protein